MGMQRDLIVILICKSLLTIRLSIFAYVHWLFDILFYKVPIQVLLSFSKTGLPTFFTLICISSFYIFWIEALCEIHIENIFPTLWLAFYSLIWWLINRIP